MESMDARRVQSESRVINAMRLICEPIVHELLAKTWRAYRSYALR